MQQENSRKSGGKINANKKNNVSGVRGFQHVINFFLGEAWERRDRRSGKFRGNAREGAHD